MGRGLAGPGAGGWFADFRGGEGLRVLKGAGGEGVSGSAGPRRIALSKNSILKIPLKQQVAGK